jgi:hypothetical protein
MADAINMCVTEEEIELIKSGGIEPVRMFKLGQHSSQCALCRGAVFSAIYGGDGQCPLEASRPNKAVCLSETELMALSTGFELSDRHASLIAQHIQSCPDCMIKLRRGLRDGEFKEDKEETVIALLTRGSKRSSTRACP